MESCTSKIWIFLTAHLFLTLNLMFLQSTAWSKHVPAGLKKSVKTLPARSQMNDSTRNPSKSDFFIFLTFSILTPVNIDSAKQSVSSWTAELHCIPFLKFGKPQGFFVHMHKKALTQNAFFLFCAYEHFLLY